MSGGSHGELPDDLVPVMRRAIRLQWLTIGYMLTAIVVVGLTLGQSQAMKAVWVEDALSLFPPAAFLLAARVRRRPPDSRHAWGYHRITSIAFLAAALALLVFGLVILGDSLLKLVTAERPPIGVMPLFGHEVRAGWPMLAAIAYTGIPPVFLGHAKRRLARELHDKVLYADAEMNRADWMTAIAASLGILGIGFGLWFADAAAGALISIDIVRDGWRNVKAAGNELMDARPTTYDLERDDPLLGEVRTALLAIDWVEDVLVRLREEGHVLAGEAQVVVREGAELGIAARLEDAERRLSALHWRLHDVRVIPVSAKWIEARRDPS